jgi:hypothetical protein
VKCVEFRTDFLMSWAIRDRMDGLALLNGFMGEVCVF